MAVMNLLSMLEKSANYNTNSHLYVFMTGFIEKLETGNLEIVTRDHGWGGSESQFCEIT